MLLLFVSPGDLSKWKYRIEVELILFMWGVFKGTSPHQSQPGVFSSGLPIRGHVQSDSIGRQSGRSHKPVGFQLKGSIPITLSCPKSTFPVLISLFGLLVKVPTGDHLLGPNCASQSILARDTRAVCR